MKTKKKILTAADLIKVLGEVSPKTKIVITCATPNGSSLLAVKKTGYGQRECDHGHVDNEMYFFLEFDIKHLIGDL